jgi:hypothetical protein
MTIRLGWDIINFKALQQNNRQKQHTHWKKVSGAGLIASLWFYGQ